MTRVRHFVLAMILIVAGLTAETPPVIAQEPGSGGPIIQGSGSISVGPLNDLRCTTNDCAAITRWLTVGFTGIDPNTHTFIRNVEGVLAKDWAVSDDGLTYTFSLYDNLMWSDGEPVDGWDYQFAFYAYKHADEFESPYSYRVDDIESVDVSDDGYTVTITFGTTICGVLSDAVLRMVPSHVFDWTPDMGEDFDWYSLIGHPYEEHPTVSGGPFVFKSRDIERIVLLANEHYYKPVIPEGLIYVIIDSSMLTERFIGGELNVLQSIPPVRLNEIRLDSDLQVFTYPGSSWVYMALNLADPAKPMIGFETDEDGNMILDENGDPLPVEQAPHPLFHDLRVRQAIQMAINVDEIIEKVIMGEGEVMPSYLAPSSWAYNPDLTPLGYDRAASMALLKEAGWEDTNGDGVLDRDGKNFAFELVIAPDVEGARATGELIQQHLAAIGMEVKLSPTDFNQAVDIMYGQTFDAIIHGWNNTYFEDPDVLGLFGIESDLPGSGLNGTSYHNLEVDRLLKEARQVPGCHPADRAPLYYEVQRILQEDQAYIWLYARNSSFAANRSITNWRPQPYNLFNRAEEWKIVR